MAPPPSDENIKKRLKSVNSTQESVQTCSKWIIHHRESIDKVANCWMELYKTGKDKTRTALIFVLNDIVQKAAAKRDINITLTFHPHLINATTISSLAVKKAISRCVEVFEQRNIYPQHIIEEMKAALVSKIATEKDESQNPGDIEFPNMIREIEKYYKNEILTEKAREILARSSFNFKESVQARVKDRNEGVKALADMDTSRLKLLSFLNTVEEHRKNGLRLMDMVKQAQATFNLQLRDVTVVNDAYDKFAEGIRDTKQKLEVIAATGMGESPPRDAPSPTAGDDPFLHGVDGEELDGGGDDMEMDEEDKPGPSSCFLKKEYIASIPIPESDPRIQRMGSGGNAGLFGQQQFMAPMASPGNRNAVMDPRQAARFFAQNQQLQQMAPQFQPPNTNLPPPGISPPPHQSTTIGMNDDLHEMKIDTSQPPPFFSFHPPNIANGSSVNVGKGGMTSPAMYDPTNPPPFPHQSMMNTPPPSMLQLSPPPNFSIPPPGLVHPPPLFSQSQNQQFTDRNQGHNKRRNSSEFDFKTKRGRNEGGGHWQRDGWRRSFAGGEAGQYRH